MRRRPLAIVSAVLPLLSTSGCACLVSDAPLYREGATPGDLGMFPSGCRQVEVTAAAFDDAALRRIYSNLQARGVQSLNLGNTRVTDASLELICELKTLRWIDLEGTRVTSAGVARLHARIPALEILETRAEQQAGDSN